jgi:kumamolisin
MKKFTLLLATTGVIASQLPAQNPNSNGIGYAYGYGNGTVVVPASSVENPADQGRRAHTNHLIFLRNPGGQTYLSGLTPANIQTAYSLPATPGGAGIIAIVDAYHYAGAFSDLTTFSKTYLAPDVLAACDSAFSNQPCFGQVYADSSGNLTAQQPSVNCGWNQEAALDIEWAHAMAPKATIVLVEAQSSSYADLFGAVKAATNIITTFGAGGEDTMRWGGSEFSGETAYDKYFPDPTGNSNVAFIGSSGDSGGKTIYPSASPHVIAAGGTTLKMTSAGFVSETGWSGSGGGPSRYEPAPLYQSQSAYAGVIGTQRGVPDFSFDADPSTGVLVYGPTCSGGNTGWMIFGGTSVSAPSLAGIINSAAAAGAGFATTSTELERLYGLGGGLYRDILSGRAGKYNAAAGWDFVTGIGTPLTLSGK